jgi:hypothetical protein
VSATPSDDPSSDDDAVVDRESSPFVSLETSDVEPEVVDPADRLEDDQMPPNR